jgi:uncharacterized protein YggU (UPF0235/DUF167 family)
MAAARRTRSPADARSTAAPPPVVAASAVFVTTQAEGVHLVDVAAVPNAARTEAVGLHDGALRVRLAAQPIEGAANDAMQRWLADALGVARQRVSLVRGASGRRKRWRVEASAVQLSQWLATLRAAGVID